MVCGSVEASAYMEIDFRFWWLRLTSVVGAGDGRWDCSVSMKWMMRAIDCRQRVRIRLRFKKLAAGCTAAV